MAQSLSVLGLYYTAAVFNGTLIRNNMYDVSGYNFCHKDYALFYILVQL